MNPNRIIANRWEIISELDSGGQGVTYKAVDTSNPSEGHYVVKLLKGGLSSASEKAVERFRTEFQTIKKINHVNILKVIDSNLEGDEPYSITEFCAGGNLAKAESLWQDNQKVAIEIFLEVCRGLSEAHKLDIVHRDIKPENILLRTQSGPAVVADFGICYVKGDSRLTSTSESVGPKRYIAPELEDGKAENVTPAADVYSLGKLLYFLLSRGKAFHREKHRDKQFNLERLTGDERFQQVNSLLDMMIVREPSERYQSAQQVLEQCSGLTSLFDENTSVSQVLQIEELQPPIVARHTIQLPDRAISVSSTVKRVINTRTFNRLRSINQLALVDMIYPGAGYSRHLHSLRTYSYCVDLFRSLSQSPRFLAFFTPLLTKQALVCALLHDINHFPFLHTIQEATQDELKAVNLLDTFCSGKETGDTPSIYSLLENELDLSRSIFKDIVVGTYDDLLDSDVAPAYWIIKSIIDSGADIDKMAYLRDDSAYTGVAYGAGIDQTQLFASACIVQVPAGQFKGRWHLGYRDHGLSAVEELVMARYWMFRTVYWHRTNRAIMAMLLHDLRKIYVDKLESPLEFVRATMWQNEAAVLAYLDKLHRKHYNDVPAITANVLVDQKYIYRRLVSIQGLKKDKDDETKMYEAIAEMAKDAQQSATFRQKFVEALREYILREFNTAVRVSDDDVLLDVPARHLGEVGEIFIEFDDGSVNNFRDLPGIVGHASRDFERLAKRMRVFVNPSVIDGIGEEELISRRTDLLNIVGQCLPARPRTQMK